MQELGRRAGVGRDRQPHAAPAGSVPARWMEDAMKLNSALIDRTLTQFEAQALPDDHPAVSELSELFGDHTFFLDVEGLSIIEPNATDAASGRTGIIVKLASWDDTEPSSLLPHEPEFTDVVVVLEFRH